MAGNVTAWTGDVEEVSIPVDGASVGDLTANGGAALHTVRDSVALALNTTRSRVAVVVEEGEPEAGSGRRLASGGVKIRVLVNSAPLSPAELVERDNDRQQIQQSNPVLFEAVTKATAGGSGTVGNIDVSQGVRQVMSDSTVLTATAQATGGTATLAVNTAQITTRTTTAEAAKSDVIKVQNDAIKRNQSTDDDDDDSSLKWLGAFIGKMAFECRLYTAQCI